MIGGLLFLAGGRVISESAKIDRILSEMIGLGLAGACVALGLVLKDAGEPDEVEESQDSGSEDTRTKDQV